MSPGALALRAAVLRSVRAFFDGRGFVEVETPVRIAAPAPEEHIDCPPVLGADGSRTYLRASPELHMKKLPSVMAIPMQSSKHLRKHTKLKSTRMTLKLPWMRSWPQHLPMRISHTSHKTRKL